MLNPGPHDRRAMLAPGLLVAAVVTAAGTGFGGEAAAALHDLPGGVAGRSGSPVVVVAVGDAQAPYAAERVLAAGAAAVWSESSRDFPGSTVLDLDLRAGPDGRVRRMGSSRLALPEALHHQLVLDVSQLGATPPVGLFEGKEVVLTWGTPERGLHVLAPGRVGPIHRAYVLAVARGQQLGGPGLSALPKAWASAVVGTLTVAWGVLCRRWMPGRLGWVTLGATAVVGLVVLAARALGVDLPVGGLLAAFVVPAGVRVARLAVDALVVVDRLLLWLGVGPSDPTVQSSIESRARMLAVWLPRARVSAWRARPGMAPQHVWGEAGEVLSRLPAEAERGETRFLMPVRDRGEILGALLVEAPLTPSIEAFARAAAEAAGPVDLPPAATGDPFVARLDLARVAVRQALARSDRWEQFLDKSGGTIGVFDLGGSLRSGSAALRQIVTQETRLAPGEPPLLQALAGLTDALPDELRAGVRTVIGAGRTVRLAGREGGDVCLLPIDASEGRAGLLLHAVPPEFERRTRVELLAAVRDAAVPNRALTVRLNTGDHVFARPRALRLALAAVLAEAQESGMASVAFEDGHIVIRDGLGPLPASTAAALDSEAVARLRPLARAAGLSLDIDAAPDGTRFRLRVED